MTKDETHIQRMCDGMMQMRMHEMERKHNKRGNSHIRDRRDPILMLRLGMMAP